MKSDAFSVMIWKSRRWRSHSSSACFHCSRLSSRCVISLRRPWFSAASAEDAAGAGGAGTAAAGWAAGMGAGLPGGRLGAGAGGRRTMGRRADAG